LRADALDRLPSPGYVPHSLSIGLTPAFGKQTMLDSLRPLADYLSTQLKRPVHLRVSSSYEESLQQISKGEVHAAIFTPVIYVKARRTLPIVPVASPTGPGLATYMGYIVVHRSSEYETIDDLKGKRIAWVDPSSTSGYLFPYLTLTRIGVDPASFFSQEVFTGTHYNVIRAVINGEVETGAVCSRFVDPTIYNHIAEAHQLRVIAKTGRIPLDTVVVHNNIDRKFARKVQNALLALTSHPQAHAALVKSWGIADFVKPNDALYQSVEDAVKLQRRVAADIHDQKRKLTPDTFSSAEHL